jgi:hypothetical protein
MANQILYQSSILHGILLLIVIYGVFHKIPLWMSCLCLVIIYTSLWNHGTSNIIAKACDRFMVLFGIFVLVIFVYESTLQWKYFLIFSFLLSFFLLLFSKLFDQSWRTRIHLCAHMIGTFSMILLICFLCIDNQQADKIE